MTDKERMSYVNFLIDKSIKDYLPNHQDDKDMVVSMLVECLSCSDRISHTFWLGIPQLFEAVCGSQQPGKELEKHLDPKIVKELLVIALCDRVVKQLDRLLDKDVGYSYDRKMYNAQFFIDK